MTQSKKESKTVRFISWNAAQIQERSAHLRSLGFAIDASPISADALREMRQNPPTAFVIDLSRQPSGGRDIAVNLRRFKTTRLVPLLFIEGEPDKTERIRALLPDAHFTSWALIAPAIRTALAHPPSNPTIPSSGMAAYAGVSLAKKLGLEREVVITLVDAPPGFAKKLEPLPAGTRVMENARDPVGLTLWFVRSERELRDQIRRMVPLARGGSLWIAWQKKASADAGGLTQALVRTIAISAGLVDFKICSLDDTWSGLRFSLAKSETNQSFASGKTERRSNAAAPLAAAQQPLPDQTQVNAGNTDPSR